MSDLAEPRLSVSVSVLDGDITVWVLRDGHAYPMETAEAALIAAAEGAGVMDMCVPADATYTGLRYRDDVWWDQTPPSLTEGVDRV